MACSGGEVCPIIVLIDLLQVRTMISRQVSGSAVRSTPLSNGLRC